MRRSSRFCSRQCSIELADGASVESEERSNGLKFCAERGLFEAGQGAEVRGLYPHRQSVSIAATSAELQFGCRVHHLPSDASIHRWMLASGCRSRRRISMWMLRAASTIRCRGPCDPPVEPEADNLGE